MCRFSDRIGACPVLHLLSCNRRAHLSEIPSAVSARHYFTVRDEVIGLIDSWHSLSSAHGGISSAALAEYLTLYAAMYHSVFYCFPFGVFLCLFLTNRVLFLAISTSFILLYVKIYHELNNTTNWSDFILFIIDFNYQNTIMVILFAKVIRTLHCSNM